MVDSTSILSKIGSGLVGIIGLSSRSSSASKSSSVACCGCGGGVSGTWLLALGRRAAAADDDGEEEDGSSIGTPCFTKSEICLYHDLGGTVSHSPPIDDELPLLLLLQWVCTGEARSDIGGDGQGTAACFAATGCLFWRGLLEVISDPFSGV